MRFITLAAMLAFLCGFTGTGVTITGGSVDADPWAPLLTGGPYNLSAHETDIKTVWSTASSAPSWPTAPTTSSSVNWGDPSMDDCTELGNADSVQITFGAAASADCTSGGVTFSGTDVDIIMANDAEIDGAVTFSSTAQRIRITGGNIGNDTASYYAINFSGGDDILMDNVHMYLNSGAQNSGGVPSRVAFVDVTWEAQSECLLNGATSPESADWIFASVHGICEKDAGTTTGAFRFSRTTNHIWVDSRLTLEDAADNTSAFRYHGDAGPLLIADNEVVYELNPAQHFFFFSENNVNADPQPTERSNIHVYDNDAYFPASTGNITSEAITGYDLAGGDDSSFDVWIENNTVHADAGNSAFNVNVNGTTPTATYSTTGNTASTYSTTPALASGADH